MKTGGAARAIDHGCLQVVDDDGARTGPKELQGVRQAPIEFRLALGEGELDVGEPAVAKHGHQGETLRVVFPIVTRPHSPQSTCMAKAGSQWTS
jgi:hypothetical protein